mgnify:CR=1 FL=1
MKTPITYYGGKQTLLKYLLPLIPQHKMYCEPFFGGGAVFFAKPKSEVEVINDINGEIVNFFKVIKTKFPELQKEIKAVRPQKVVTESGSIVQLFDGVAVVDGLPKAKNGEIVNFPHGITGMVIDLPERYTAVLVFKDYN